MKKLMKAFLRNSKHLLLGFLAFNIALNPLFQIIGLVLLLFDIDIFCWAWNYATKDI